MTDEPSPSSSGVRPFADSQSLLELIGRLESIERRTSENSSSKEGLLQRLAALEGSLHDLQTTRGIDDKNSGAEDELQRKLQESMENARAQKLACLEARLMAIEKLLASTSGTFLSPKPLNPLSPKSDGLLSPKTPNPEAKRLKAMMGNFERRFGGLEARLDALASNEASSLAEVRARVQGLDKRVQGLHRHVNLEAQLSKRVATAEWRLEQVRLPQVFFSGESWKDGVCW